jgi:hypothetical protein
VSVAPSLGPWGALALAAIAVAACVRLAAWWRIAPAEERAAPWRLAVLLVAQPLLAALLYLTLFPPPMAGAGAGTLSIATRDAPRRLAAAGERLIVLPEAPSGLGGEAAPDLATALRRHPEVARLRVLGQGLEPRDRPAAQGRALVFEPAAAPAGVAELYLPAPVAPGAGFTVAGRVEGQSGGTVDLLDPAGQVADSQPLPASGEFTLTGAAREPGAALFAVRLRNQGHTVETVDAPVWTAAAPAPKVLLLAGAPGPEIKALRRWAADSGIALQTAVTLGGGLELGDPRPPLNAATLDRLDLVVVDERSWAGLSPGDRAALAAAVREGLGLLLRVTGPLPAGVRDEWRTLGLPLEGGEAAIAARLAPSGPSPAASPDEIPLPDLTRRRVDIPAEGSTPLLRDATRAVLARWRAEGLGRLGVWSVTDSAGLVTAGFGQRYGDLWGTMVAALARPAPAAIAVSFDSDPREGRRLVLCGLKGEAQVREPSGAWTRLVDPATGVASCAGYWPAGPGWRILRLTVPGESTPQEQGFYVRPAAQAPGLIDQDDRTATRALAAAPAAPGAAGGPVSKAPGSPWPWFLAWLLAATALWRFERATPGRAATQAASDPAARRARERPLDV